MNNYEKPMVEIVKFETDNVLSNPGAGGGVGDTSQGDEFASLMKI